MLGLRLVNPEGSVERPSVFRRRAAFAAAGLLLLVSAAPDGARLTVDASVFSDDECLAPASTRCAFDETLPDGEPRPSASAALLPPQTRSVEASLLLKPRLEGLWNFGPQILPIRRRLPVRATVAAAAAALPSCISRVRHRPDRPGCGKPVRRRLR